MIYDFMFVIATKILRSLPFRGGIKQLPLPVSCYGFVISFGQCIQSVSFWGFIALLPHDMTFGLFFSRSRWFYICNKTPLSIACIVMLA